MKLVQPEELWQIRAINTHSHNMVDWQPPCSLYAMLQKTYSGWLIRDPGDCPAGIQEYFSRLSANSYFSWWRKSVELLYGDGRPLTVESWDWYDQAVLRAYSEQPEHNTQLLRKRCGYDAIILDDYHKPGCDHGAPGLFRPAYRCDMFLCGWAPDVSDENGNCARIWFERRPATLDEYTDEVEKAVDKAVRAGCKALKIAIAYERTLEFGPDTRPGALKAWQTGGKTAAQRKAFGDYMMFMLAHIAAVHDLPVQIHTGLGALQGSRALGLRALIERNPATKFDLFHAGYPWCGDVLALAHNYPNAAVDLCWLPLISTARAVSFLQEALEVLPADKLLWGCDTWTAEESYGARMAMHHCLLEVLNQLIAEGTINHAYGVQLARGILYGNAQRLYAFE